MVTYTKQQLDEIVKRHMEMQAQADLLAKVAIIIASIVLTWWVMK